MADNDSPKYSGFDYGVISNPDGSSSSKITCFPSNNERCTVVRTPGTVSSEVGFYNPRSEDSFHDRELKHATKEINQIIQKLVDSSSRPSNAKLHILKTENGPMFAWVESHVNVIKGVI